MIAILALLVPFAVPAESADPLPAANDFILRAPVAEAAGIAARNNLTIVSEISSAVDEDGHGIFLVRAAPGALPALVISDIQSFEPEAAGIEQAVLASLPELDQSAALILDTSSVDSALGAIFGFDPPTATLSATWNGHQHDRAIEGGKSEELEFEFEQVADTDPANYDIQVEFSGNQSSYQLGLLVVNGNQVAVEITNLGGDDLSLDSATITWPATNGKLMAASLHNDSLLDNPYQEFGDYPDGSPRNVWTGYLNQAATLTLEVDQAQKLFEGQATVAIIDTGIDPTHALLAARIVPGYDFVHDVAGVASEWVDVDQSAALILDQSAALILDQSAALILDQSAALILDQSAALILDTSSLPPAFGHGTMVAGIIHRVAPEASLMPLKAFDGNGHAHLYDVIDAIFYAVDHGANVINMSFNLESFSPALMRAINYAARNGVACVSSAGNRGAEILTYPAAFGNTIGVASVDDSDGLSAFSNWGSDLVTISAPGENIVTTYPGGRYAVASGTSFSAPWIAGGVALFADKLGTKHAPGVADYYRSSNALTNADPVLGSGQSHSGYGRANLKRAVDSLKSGHYASTRPLGSYTISATFAEGCTASYPPPSTAGACAVEGAGQLSFHNKSVTWSVTNNSEIDVTLDSITIVWEADNGELKRVTVDGATVVDGAHPSTTATIDSGWLGVVEDRVFAPHQTRAVVLEFESQVIWTY
jgi:hypothetical protein